MTITAGVGTAAETGALDAELAALDAWWRAANYLAVGQIYLLDNPLLARPLRPEHIKPRLLGHWGTAPGLTFLWAHLNRVIRRSDLDALFVTGPGHGGPAVVATAWLEGTYAERFPDVSRDAAVLRARAVVGLGFLGLAVDPERNGSVPPEGEADVSATGAAVRTLVVHTREDLVIAGQVRRALA